MIREILKLTLVAAIAAGVTALLFSWLRQERVPQDTAAVIARMRESMHNMEVQVPTSVASDGLRVVSLDETGENKVDLGDSAKTLVCIQLHLRYSLPADLSGAIVTTDEQRKTLTMTLPPPQLTDVVDAAAEVNFAFSGGDSAGVTAAKNAALSMIHQSGGNARYMGAAKALFLDHLAASATALGYQAQINWQEAAAPAGHRGPL